MGNIGNRILPVVFGFLVVTALAGCAMNRPPQRIQKAIQSVNKYLPEYVDESNKALAEIGHPEGVRLAGTGMLLVEVLEALEAWADGKGQVSSEKTDDF